jgi:hypothetical protein
MKKNNMKRMTLICALLLACMSAFAQTGSIDPSGARVHLADSTKAVPGTKGALFYFDQASGDHWRIWNNGVKSKLSQYFTGGGGSDLFASNVTFVLPAGKCLGKYCNGDIAPWAGLTAVQALQDAAVAYISPIYTSFTVVSQPTTVEVGTTITGSKLFNWAITVNSGVVPTIDIVDNTGTIILLAGTPNDGTQTVTVTTRQLNSNGATQSWSGLGNNTSPAGTFPSGNFVVTARFYRFYGPASASVGSSADVRALPASAFQTGAGTFNLLTGTSLTKFIVALPTSVTITSVVDLDALSAVITSEYVFQGTLNVLDAGGTNRVYNIYEMNVGSPYSTSHRHAITTN